MGKIIEQEQIFHMTLGKGSRVNYLDPFLTSYNQEEIFHHLFNICRYNGAIKVDLARHSLLVGKLVATYTNDPVIIAKAVTHDFQECIVGDVVTGLKTLLPAFSDIEKLWEDWVAVNLQLPKNSELSIQDRRLIKEEDTRALVVETTYFKHGGLPVFNQLYGTVDESELAIGDNIFTAPDWQIKLQIENMIKRGQEWQ